MVDINFIRGHTDELKLAIHRKKIDLDLDQLLDVDRKRREVLGKIEELRRQRNEAAKLRDIEQGKQLKTELDSLDQEYQGIEIEFNQLMVKVPTIPSPDTPVGESDKDNPVVSQWGDKREFSFTPKDHIQLGKELGILDLERGAKVGGYRGYFLKNQGALLVMGIMMYALQKMVYKGYQPMIPPTLVKQYALFGSGYFKGLEYNPETDEIYQVASPDKELDGNETTEKKFLVGTAEPSLLAYFSDEILKEEELPIKVSGFSQCYRSEIGSYGKDTKGMYRVHEFMKVEQVVLCKDDPKEAEKLQEEMLGISEEMHQELGLPYQKLQICTGDLSAGKYRQFDLEAWMPGLNRYGETGSASIFLDWQSRRLRVRYEDKQGNKHYVYMLNNTALPSPRIFIAILENYQQEDGSVKIPEVLVPYTGFAEINKVK